VVRGFGEYIIAKGKWTAAERAARIERLGHVAFKFSYFVIVSVIGYRILKDQSWIPWVLGGSGNIENTFNGHPAHNLTPAIRNYYMIQLAYHLSSFIYQFMFAHRMDFYEMLLHHSVTVAVIVYSYCMNFVRIGTVVYFLHDVSDIFSYAVKMSVDTPFKKLTLTIYGLLLAVWGYTRMFVFPFYVLYMFAYFIQQGFPRLGIFVECFYVMTLGALQILHIYWYSLFVAMGLKYKKSGKTDDTQEDLGTIKKVKEKKEK
jgi:ceramide synthetase